MKIILLLAVLASVNFCSSSASAGSPAAASPERIDPDSLRAVIKAELVEEILDGMRAVHPTAPSVPESIEFAGKTYRFDTDAMYERMDRELIAFTYMHTNSTLMLKRSTRYFRMVEPILKANGVPEDLKYLMAIESNLDPKAVSVSGAAGLWQFLKSTAPQYGLEVSSEVDERYNIEKETEAACKYFKEAYAKYGDWLTVAASYNAGQGGITKRLSDQKQSSALNLFLPEETSRYMFRILVAKMFFTDPESFGFNVPKEDYYPYREPRKVVTVTTAIPSLPDFAADNGVTYADLRNANLWMLGTKLSNPSGKTYKIIIPTVK
ncbi:MAG: lytic transglycosylase domain-containing protein [Bacteroidales bacterium]|nr:lytic transglycosylase domain-containing protein [Bacteroidales bacterium]